MTDGDYTVHGKTSIFKFSPAKTNTVVAKYNSKKNTKAIQRLQYVFVDDHELHQINLDFLKHDTLTDIITFDLGTTSSTIDGEIYISLDRVKENSATLNTLYFEELIRVISHGLLHLIGFKDKTSKDVATMRSKEEECLSLWRSIQ